MRKYDRKNAIENPRFFDACVRSQLAYPFFFCLPNFCQQKSLVHLSCALRTPLQVHQPNMNENHSVYGHVFTACLISCATPFVQRITIGLVAHIELFPQLQLKVWMTAFPAHATNQMSRVPMPCANAHELGLLKHDFQYVVFLMERSYLHYHRASIMLTPPTLAIFFFE